MNKIISFIMAISALSLAAQVPYELSPDFITNPNGHYATGLGIADINGDGWKDIIVANGNDMSRQRLVVYYNNGNGTFPADPDWYSDDVDFHGHLSAGDIDNDGDVDIAVSVYLGPNGFGYPGKVKIYYNTDTGLESSPSFQSEYFYTFSCALGDADADGDLDLAVACGEPYNAEYDYGRIFYNNGGSFNTVADWQSNVQMGALDVEFGDLDQNGYLDLVFVCESTQNYVFLADNQGNIDEYWDWHSDHPQNFMNSVDIGKSRVNGSTCFVSTGNDQLGGDGMIKQFMFTNPVPSYSSPTWASDYVGYGSGILMADINHDDFVDLVYGSWWGPMTILEGCYDEWINTPVFQATSTSVVEAIQMSDLGKFNYQGKTINAKAIGQHALIQLEEPLIEKINAIYVNNVSVARADYCYVEMKNWISLKNDIMPGDVFKVEYEYTYDGDIVISNWDPGKGNFIYYNTMNPVTINEYEVPGKDLYLLSVSPVPADGPVTVRYSSKQQGPVRMNICDMSGKVYFDGIIEDGLPGIREYTFSTSHLADGVYILKISNGQSSNLTKFLVHR